jgi:hypothetical protein
MTQAEFFETNKQAVINFLKANMVGFADLLEQHPNIAKNDIEGWLQEGFENAENGYAHIELPTWLGHTKKPEVLDLTYTCSDYQDLLTAIRVNDEIYHNEDGEQYHDSWLSYTHKDVTKINVAYYCGNKHSVGDCWIASYYTNEKNAKFDAKFATIAEFESMNGCFPTEIINIEYIEGVK